MSPQLEVDAFCEDYESTGDCIDFLYAFLKKFHSFSVEVPLAGIALELRQKEDGKFFASEVERQLTPEDYDGKADIGDVIWVYGSDDSIDGFVVVGNETNWSFFRSAGVVSTKGRIAAIYVKLKITRRKRWVS